MNTKKFLSLLLSSLFASNIYASSLVQDSTGGVNYNNAVNSSVSSQIVSCGGQAYSTSESCVGNYNTGSINYYNYETCNTTTGAKTFNKVLVSNTCACNIPATNYHYTSCSSGYDGLLGYQRSYYCSNGSTGYTDTLISNTCKPACRCFVGETEITMSDGSKKLIKDIHLGDEVLVYEFSSNSFVKSIVTALYSKETEETYVLDNSLRMTKEHPLLREDNQWVAIDPTESQEIHGDKTEKLNIGDKIKKINNLHEVKNLELIKEKTIVYTFTVEHKDHNYIANDFIVHNKRESNC